MSTDTFDERNEEQGATSGFDRTTDQHSQGQTANGTTTSLASTLAHTAVSQASLGSSTEGLVLYDLTNSHDQPKEFSPHCVKTVLGLKLLDVGYDRQRLTFAQIRSQLTQRIDDGAATVPTLELADGTHLKDSWQIAVWLAQYHDAGHRLFPYPSSRPFAATLNAWGKTTMAPHLGKLIRPAVWQHLEGESKDYFEHVKVGIKTMDALRRMDADARQQCTQQCIQALEPIQAALAAIHDDESRGSRQNGQHAPLWLEGGPAPTHADFVIFGWYVFTRTAGPALTQQIWHAHPLVARWVQDLLTWAGSEITGDFV